MAEQNLPITSWAEDDRPREKLLQKGAAALSTNELFAILLRSGGGGESAIDLSRRILSDCNNDLNVLAAAGVRELMNKYKGVGMAKAASVIAAMEIGRRRKDEAAELSSVVKSSFDAFRYIAPLLNDLDHEEFWLLYLGNSNRISGSEMLFSGGMDATVIDVRIIFRKALEMKASSIIVVHNHPGGTLRPSEYDIITTQKIREAGSFLDIRLQDHIIICEGGYFSFRDEDLLNVKSTGGKSGKSSKK